MTTRRLASIFMVVIALSGCGQGGSAATANQAADAFLWFMAHRDVDAAWSYLAPETRQSVYDDDMSAFARDVNRADWSQLAWEFGPVVDLDYAWEVHVIADEASVPLFLDETGVGPNWAGNGFILQVQIPYANTYRILAEAR
jgi:hypothetical protein